MVDQSYTGHVVKDLTVKKGIQIVSNPPSTLPRLVPLPCLSGLRQTPVIHVLDASRSVTVVGALLSERKADYVEVKHMLLGGSAPYTCACCPRWGCVLYACLTVVFLPSVVGKARCMCSAARDPVLLL